MSTRLRGAVFVLTVVSVVVVGGLGVRAIRAPETPDWPGRIAVIGLNEANPRQPVSYLGVADPITKAIATVPPDAVVEIPGSGFLRAYHAYRLGGAEGVRDTLGRLFGVDVPFSVRGPGDHFDIVATSFTTAEIVPDRTEDLRATLEEAVVSWERREVSGERREGPQGTYLILNPASVADAASAIGGLGTRVFVDPSSLDAGTGEIVEAPAGSALPAPTDTPVPLAFEPADIAVDVLNGGDVDMAATRTADKLRPLGYNVVRIGDFTPQTRDESFVYYRADTEDKGRQVAEELGYPIEEVPDDVESRMRQSADVLVLLGDDAKVEDSPE